MKYYGFLYAGMGRTYNYESSTPFDSEYEALKEANKSWDADPNLQIARLLVVLRVEECGDPNVDLKYAFFQFTNSNSCRMFIENKEKVVWSNNDEQYWNGNAHMMG